MRTGVVRSVIFLMCVLTARPYSEMHARLAVVSRPVVNLYSSASEDADVVSQAIFGTNTEVLEEKSDWRRIKTPDQYTGWVPLSGLVETSMPYAAEGKVARVGNVFTSVYREASVTKHQPLWTLPFDSRLQVIAKEDERWLKVELPDKRIGYVQLGDVRLESARLSPGESVDFSKRFLGLPYLWGGTSAYGYDCSGFTQMLMSHRGVQLPRDASVQARSDVLRTISREELRPGDLLFFGPSEQKITHTGYYIGDGDFIHATAHENPVIQISRLADPHWTELFVGARRAK